MWLRLQSAFGVTTLQVGSGFFILSNASHHDVKNSTYTYIYTCQIIVLSKLQTNVGWKQLLIKMKLEIFRLELKMMRKRNVTELLDYYYFLNVLSSRRWPLATKYLSTMWSLISPIHIIYVSLILRYSIPPYMISTTQQKVKVKSLRLRISASSSCWLIRRTVRHILTTEFVLMLYVICESLTVTWNH